MKVTKLVREFKLTSNNVKEYLEASLEDARSMNAGDTMITCTPAAGLPVEDKEAVIASVIASYGSFKSSMSEGDLKIRIENGDIVTELSKDFAIELFKESLTKLNDEELLNDSANNLAENMDDKEVINTSWQIVCDPWSYMSLMTEVKEYMTSRELDIIKFITVTCGKEGVTEIYCKLKISEVENYLADEKAVMEVSSDKDAFNNKDAHFNLKMVGTFLPEIASWWALSAEVN